MLFEEKATEVRFRKRMKLKSFTLFIYLKDKNRKINSDILTVIGSYNFEKPFLFFLRWLAIVWIVRYMLLPDQLLNIYIEHSRRRYEFKLCRMLIALLSLSDQKSEKISRDDLILFFFPTHIMTAVPIKVLARVCSLCVPPPLPFPLVSF